MIPLVLLVLAVVLVTAGTAVIYWPAALIVVGLALGAIAILFDFDRPLRPGKGRR